MGFFNKLHSNYTLSSNLLHLLTSCLANACSESRDQPSRPCRDMTSISLSTVEFTGARIGSPRITIIRALNLLMSQKVTDHMYLAWVQLLCLINTRQHAEH